MNEFAVTGKQLFMGKEIPVVLGGFGADKRGILANMDREENQTKLGGIMNKALQGILATHGAEETITHLFNLLDICIRTGGPLCGMEAAREDIPNDLEYLNHLMENFPLLDENGAELALNTESPWRIAEDRGRLEAAADNRCF